jgi:hypothetical protein
LEDADTSIESYVTSAASTELTTESTRTTASLPLKGVEDTIDRLYRLSWVIRRPVAASQNAKAASFRITDDDGNEYEKEFEDFAAQMVKHRFPSTNVSLVAKLAKSITLRRKRFLYRRHHQDKLNFSVSRLHGDCGQHGNTSTLNPSAPENKLLHPSAAEESAPARDKISARTNAPSATSASAFSHQRFRNEANNLTGSVISTAIHAPDDKADSFPVPTPPKTVPGGKEFECPYCYMTLPSKEARPAQWR